MGAAGRADRRPPFHRGGTMHTYLSIAVGGALGSMARYATGIYVGRWLGTEFPWGTLLINVIGSFLIGVFAESFALRWDATQATRVFLVVGICGGYTTFSTFSLDLVTLINHGQALAAGVYIVASVMLGLLGLYAGLHAMRLIFA
jgi:fluoride exporter